jgi:hypothetical protein
MIYPLSSSLFDSLTGLILEGDKISGGRILLILVECGSD